MASGSHGTVTVNGVKFKVIKWDTGTTGSYETTATGSPIVVVSEETTLSFEPNVPNPPTPVSARKRSILTSHFAGVRLPPLAYCGDCRGKGFDLTCGNGGRSARRCQRCRGKGHTTVGTTKR